MAFTVEKVKQLAYLTRVALTDKEAENIVEDFESTMKWLEALTCADTEGIEPLHSVMDITMTLREDIVDDGGIADIIVANAPEKTETFFVVPKVVE